MRYSKHTVKRPSLFCCSAQHSRRVPKAARGERLKTWVDVARGKKQKAMPVFPTSCHDDVPRLMQATSSKMCGSSDNHVNVSTCDGRLTQSRNHTRSVTRRSVLSLRDTLPQVWLTARGLDYVVEEARVDLPSLSSNRWRFYRLYPHEGVVSHAPDADIRTAFHGTWWYALWGLLRSGRVLESNDASKGHEFWCPGAERRDQRLFVREYTVLQSLLDLSLPRSRAV